MDFRIVNNHIIVSVETKLGAKNCVFDTGSPASFLFDSANEFNIDEIPQIESSRNPLAMMVSLYRPTIENMIGEKIDGFIGTDLLMHCNVLLDFKKCKLTLTTEPLDNDFNVPMSNFFGLPIFDMTVNGTVLKAAYDSGAMYCFVSSKRAECLSLTPRNITFEDFNPMLGEFSAELYAGDIQIGSTSLEQRNIAVSTTYDAVLHPIGVDAFLGTDALTNSVIGLSYIEGRMGIIDVI